MSTPFNALIAVGSQALDVAVPNNTNLGQDLSAAGSDFATMIAGVGAAVAATQLKLATTSANTAKALAETNVDLIAVQETTYDDNGTIDANGSQFFVRRLPLIDFVDPVFYQWSQVRLQGRFFLSEIANASEYHSTTSVSHKRSGAAGGLLCPLFGGGYKTSDFRSTTTDITATSDRASAVGLARMYAQLNPRTDVGVPKPMQAIEGPSINIVQGEIQEVGAPSPSMTISLLIQLRRANGTAIANKAMSIETDGTAWEYSGSDTTDADGNVTIRRHRAFPPLAPDAPPGTEPDKTPVQVIVTARLGMVANNTTVTF